MLLYILFSSSSINSSRSSPYALIIDPSCFLITAVSVMYVVSVNVSGVNVGYIPSFVGDGGM